MGKRGSKPEAQFTYWDLRRRGMNQSEIARKYEITRQAVNKSVKLAERDVLYRLLDTAQTSGILVEWQDAWKGALIGISPQLGNMACVMILDVENRVRVFYDQDKAKDKERKATVIWEMDAVLNAALGLRVDPKMKFKEIMKLIVRGNEF